LPLDEVYLQKEIYKLTVIWLLIVHMQNVSFYISEVLCSVLLLNDDLVSFTNT